MGFSGGADSTALAIILHSLGLRVTLAHIDHRMRADSSFDAFHCRSTARRLKMPIEVVSVKVDPPTEEEARRVRYKALEQIRILVGAVRIATGHTLNDEAETVRMRLARGGFGLGIPPVRERIIRPVLNAPRRLTEAVCRESGVLYLQDPSNDDMRFTRNRVRIELATAPAAEIDRYVSIGAASLAQKQALQKRLADYLGSGGADLRPPLSRSALLAAPEPVARALLRRALAGAAVEASERLVRDILTKVAPHPGSSLDLPGGLAVWCDPAPVISEGQGAPSGPQGCLRVGRRPSTEHPMLPELQLAMPGVTVSPEWGLKAVVSYVPVPTAEALRGARRRQGGICAEIFDADALGEGLRLRQWRPGDRFHPLRRNGWEDGPASDPTQCAAGLTRRGKKLQDFFVDAKVPKAERHSTPLVTSGGSVVWVVGHRIDDRFKVTGRTRRAARIEMSLEL